MRPAPSYSCPHPGVMLAWEWNPEYETLSLKDILEAAKKEFPKWKLEDLGLRASSNVRGNMRLVLSVG